MSDMTFHALRFDNGQAVEVALAGDRVATLTPLDEPPDDLPWLSPGWVDLQVNGFGGQDFARTGLTAEAVNEISRAQLKDGVVAYCPTVTTESFEVMRDAVSAIAEACRNDPLVDRLVLGIHVEGPYISPHDGPRGAHPLPHCREPDWDEFQRWQEAAEGRINLVTLSPEYEGAATFIRQAVAAGITVAIGHTAANSAQIRAAVDAGASLSTHLGNGAHRELPRHPNYLWDQLAEDRLTASLIADGHHLPPEVVQTFVRAKHPSRCILVSDITGMAGMPPGRYADSSLGDIEVLSDGRLVIAGQRQLLAGASLPISVGIGNVMRHAGLDLKAAVALASSQPLALMGRVPPRLRPGAAADLTLFRLLPDGRIAVAATLLSGRVHFGSV